MNRYKTLRNYCGNKIEYYSPAPKTTIAIGIPCIPKHEKHLKDLFKTIKNQTTPSREVIIGISETSKNKAQKLFKTLQPLINCPLLITFTTKKAFAGENRNRIAKHSTSTLISFVDADDLMHPQRNEILLDTYNKKHPKSMVHQFTMNSKDMTKTFHTPEVKDGKYLHSLAKNKKEQASPLYAPNLHHGHITTETKLFKKIKQPEHRRRAQDTSFVGRILDAYPNDPKAMNFIKAPLTQYRIQYSSAN